MAKLGSGSVVTALTAGALVIVTMLAVQAKSSAGATTGAAHAGSTPTAVASKAPGGKPAAPPALPKDSGTGKRVVYSVSLKRVWLVDPAAPAQTRSFTVQPGTVAPAPGTYSVFRARSGPYPGSDGKQIQDAVLFTSHEGAIIGFSAAVDGSTPVPDPAKKTGGIRESVADGQALFAFAPYNTKVVVVA